MPLWDLVHRLGTGPPWKRAPRGNGSGFSQKISTAGAEMYGGLGDRHSFGLRDTSQYVAPVAAWNLPSGWTFRVSPGFGLNDNSHGFLLRWGLSYEINAFGEMVSHLFGHGK